MIDDTPTCDEAISWKVTAEQVAAILDEVRADRDQVSAENARLRAVLAAESAAADRNAADLTRLREAERDETSAEITRLRDELWSTQDQLTAALAALAEGDR